MAKRNIRHAIGFFFRKLTWRLRPLPEFLIVGVQKAGTTGLFEYMAEHPDVVGPTKKEVHFFDDKNAGSFAQGERWYRAHFPVRSKRNARPLAFEASPLYLFNPLAAARIKSVIPDARLIVLLRNPTERAVSHYLLAKRRGIEPLPMLEAFNAEAERLAPVFENDEFSSNAFIYHSYLSRGRYREQLDRYFEHFPRQQLFIENSEKLLTDTEAVLERLFEFVGVDPTFKVKDLAPKNVTANRAEVSPEVYEFLNNYFRPHNEALYELLDEDFGW